MARNNFVPMNYVSINNIINYDNEEEDILDIERNEEDKDIIEDNYIYDYLD